MSEATQIVRVWTGKTRRDRAEDYERYLERTGLAEYSATEGNVDAWFTRRDDGDLTEFALFTRWESMAAVRAFAGDEPERAVFYPEDDEFLVERDLTVAHYTLFATRAEVRPGMEQPVG
jgi:heme-degrading monooxygenase HmoA